MTTFLGNPLASAVAAASIRHEVATVRLGFLAAKAKEDE